MKIKDMATHEPGRKRRGARSCKECRQCPTIADVSRRGRHRLHAFPIWHIDIRLSRRAIGFAALLAIRALPPPFLNRAQRWHCDHLRIVSLAARGSIKPSKRRRASGVRSHCRYPTETIRPALENARSSSGCR